YQADDTKNFAGTVNASDVSITGLTYTPASYTSGNDITPGWNLLGNPFTSALTWGTANWALSSGINTTAKIWKESTAAYVDISTNGIIPAMNGFMVETSTNNASLTIPATERVHDATPWYKSSGNPYIKLIATGINTQTAQESIVTFDSQTTPGYNPDFDSHFLPGYAPSFYSVDGTEKLSTNVLPSIDNQSTIPFSFVKTYDEDNYTIEATQIENIPAQIYLTDLKLSKTQNLIENPVYSFTSAAGDDPARFLLSFSHVGISENTRTNNAIYAYENNLFIVSPDNARLEVYNLTGQKLLDEEINNSGLYQTTLQGPTGYYVVRLTTGTKVVVTKVFIKS
ncbi:MAG: T9SS type A sorting domain-containing protein, partial [Bacteroidota bacterium]